MTCVVGWELTTGIGIELTESPSRAGGSVLHVERRDGGRGRRWDRLSWSSRRRGGCVVDVVVVRRFLGCTSRGDDGQDEQNGNTSIMVDLENVVRSPSRDLAITLTV